MTKMNKFVEGERPRRSRFGAHAAIFGAVGIGIIGGSYSVAQAATRRVVGDYDGDGKTDYAYWHPSNATWYVKYSGSGKTATKQLGAKGDIPISVDYDGDGKTDYAVYRPTTTPYGTWYVIDSSTGKTVTKSFGYDGDVVVWGDYDGDKKTDLGTWRSNNGIWNLTQTSTTATVGKQWGTPGDIPVMGDYDGDGKAEIAVWRPTDLPWATWYVLYTKTGQYSMNQWGTPGDIPVVGDYDGDGRADFAIWRPSTGTWWVESIGSGATWVQQWGAPGDIPVQGDYDGDGKTDFAVWRPSNGTWYIMYFATLQTTSVQWGTGGTNGGGSGSDIPLPNNPGARNELDVQVIGQGQSNWCWAATTQMIARYSNNFTTQCQLANQRFGYTTCCTSATDAAGKCNQGGWWMLTNIGFTETDSASPLSFAQLTSEAAANRPVAYAWYWTGGGGHAMVADGAWVTSSGQQWVTINDPEPVGVGSQYDLLYSNWTGAAGYTFGGDSYNILATYE